MKSLKLVALCAVLFIGIRLSASAHPFFAPPSIKDTVDKEHFNWFNKDPKQDRIQGVSTERAYYEILSNKQSKTVIVAVIDGGVDIEHEDLQGKAWVNEDEVPDNGEDDDNNGYVDDVHGWNFLGNKDGENIKEETLEVTRLYRQLKPRFEDKSEDDISQKDKSDYELYLKVKAEYEEELEYAQAMQSNLPRFYENYLIVKEVLAKHFETEDYTEKDLKKLKKKDTDGLGGAADLMLTALSMNFSKEIFEEYKEHFDNQVNYSLNTAFRGREELIGDDVSDITDNKYGNNDVIGKRANHGTHVAGIIAATRNNEIGINGIAEDVKIMTLRTVPDGDERDKDVALSIRYAVDNGAKIINCSFGKAYSPYKKMVDDAIRYAEEKDVLIIHAAGNEALNIDTIPHYPTNHLDDGSIAKNWITVGASAYKKGKNLPGDFSNYGQTGVDVFAPGVDIYSLKPENQYVSYSGTSMAAPVVTGVAALLMSYYPELSIYEVKEILMESSIRHKRPKVLRPDEESDQPPRVKFETLSITGGVVNAYEAVKMAEERTQDKK